MSGKKKLKKNQKKRLAKMFVKIMGITLALCLVIIGSLVGCYNSLLKEDGGTTTREEKEKKEGKNKEKPQEYINKNLAVFGVDKDGYRTDVIFVVNFNSKTGKIKVASLPRDTKVTWTEEQKDKLRADGKYTVNVSKLNEMTSYGGIENIKDYTVDQIENILGVKIDNYVIISIDAFRQIVDAVDGIDMYVPQNMYHTDRAGGLYINLKEGQQHLNGEQAEQLVRFRGYKDGDVDRIKVQQDFLKAFSEKILSPSIITSLPKIISTLFNTVKTDISLLEVPQYSGYINSISTENISFHTLPGEGGYEGGVSYFFPNMDLMDEFVNEVFFDQTLPGETSNTEVAAEPVIIEDKTVSIEILNGTGITGAASNAKALLEEGGYVVSTIGNYEQIDVATTLIYAKDVRKAEQFKKYYSKALIRQSDTIEQDIQIILGKDE